MDCAAHHIGPGSARVQVVSPTDRNVALHITQASVRRSRASADSLRTALGAEHGIFVEFNPSDRRVDRDAVTYREIRSDHHVAWTVLLDGSVRIAVGCQSPPGSEHLVREACDRAIDPRMRCSSRNREAMEPNGKRRRRTFHNDMEDGRTPMTTPAGGSLNTDFGLMTAVAGKTDARNEEIRAMLQSFIGQMSTVPARYGAGRPRPDPRRRGPVERRVDQTPSGTAADRRNDPPQSADASRSR